MSIQSRHVKDLEASIKREQDYLEKIFVQASKSSNQVKNYEDSKTITEIIDEMKQARLQQMNPLSESEGIKDQ